MNLHRMFPVSPANDTQCPRSKILDACLGKIKSMMAPMGGDHDGAFAELVLTSDDYVEPLGKNQMLVLGAGLHVAARHFASGAVDKPIFGYSDIQSLTERFGGKPMGAGSIHGAILDLLEKGLIERHPDLRSDRQGRPAANFSITPEGCVAFRMSVLAAHAIREGTNTKAA